MGASLLRAKCQRWPQLCQPDHREPEAVPDGSTGQEGRRSNPHGGKPREVGLCTSDAWSSDRPLYPGGPARALLHAQLVSVVLAGAYQAEVGQLQPGGAGKRTPKGRTLAGIAGHGSEVERAPEGTAASAI